MDTGGFLNVLITKKKLCVRNLLMWIFPEVIVPEVTKFSEVINLVEATFNFFMKKFPII